MIHPQFINDKQSLVTEAIDGLVRASGGRLARLDGYPHIKVVVRAEHDGSKVALVSGGGSGHEPAQAGFVGSGLLTASVCGDVFASPSVDAVLAGILAVTGRAGCLLIVTNYTGDRLNFGLAAERARALGRQVEMVIVDDDVALPDLPQARGVAGTLLVHKIAGALAEQGASLAEVAAAARAVIADVVSIGMSLGTCTVPGSAREDRIPAGRAELGIGIHGEAGIELVDFSGAQAAMAMVVEKLLPHVGQGDHVALLNNLGGTTTLEMSVLVEELRRSALGARVKWLVGPAVLMSSLDMHGFSLSLLPVNSQRVAALQAPVGTNAWPRVTALVDVQLRPLPDGLSAPAVSASPHPERRALIERCCRALIDAESTLNALDARSGDGDTGTTLATAARALTEKLAHLPLADTAALYRALGVQLAQTMGGSSGVLLGIFFAAAGDAAARGDDALASLSSGLQRVMQVGGAAPGDRTMIDALAPALAALNGGTAAAMQAARSGADSTAAMTRARAGRSAYVPSARLKGCNDPGAEAVAVVFEALARPA